MLEYRWPRCSQILELPRHVTPGTKLRDAVAKYLEHSVAAWAEKGWEFCRIGTVGIRHNPGSIGALPTLFFRISEPTFHYCVVTYRKRVRREE